MARLFIIHIGQYLNKPNSGVYQKTMSIANSISQDMDVCVVGFGKGVQHQKSSVLWNDCEGLDIWKVIDSWLTAHISKEDRIIIRYPFASRGLLELVSKWGKQVFLEHNTKEESEAIITQRRAWKLNGLSFSMSFLRYTWSTWITKKTQENVLGPLVLSKVAGGICVTHEIAEYEASRYKGYSTYTMPNGIDRISPHSTSLTWNGRSLNLVMILGSFSEWHGVERLVRKIENVEKLGLKVEIDIIGLDGISFLPIKNTSFFRVNFLGIKSEDEIERLMPNYHLAIGSLGLHRIKLKEACPLKVREYWANGLPVILSYNDTACINHIEMEKWVIKMPADESPINWEKVKEYIENLYINLHWKEDLRKDADRFLKYDNYKSDLISFIFKK